MRRVQPTVLRPLALAFALALATTSAAVAQETPTPASGDTELSAELPPPDLPTSNVEGYTFDLRVSLRADLEGVAREAAVYELVRQEPTVESVGELAAGLGIEGDVEDRGDGSFAVSGDGELFVTLDLVQFFSSATAAEGELPSDEKAVSTAKDWLREAKLLPPDIGEGEVVTRIDDASRLIVDFGPAEPVNVLAAYPSITITLAADGTVLEAAVRWANIVRADVYQLMEIEQAWQMIESNQAFLDPDLAEAGLPGGSDVRGRATFGEIEIAYATSGPPGGRQYLQPVYVFSGRVRIEGDDERTFPVTAYVPALANSGAPVG